MHGDAFDRLFDRGREAVLAGTHLRDALPADSGRWGITVVLIPDSPCLRHLDALTAEAIAIAGDGHWPTGSAASAHVTVRALEHRRGPVDVNDPLLRRYAVAVKKAAAMSKPVRLRFRGLTLTPSGIMACAHSADETADDFAATLGENLGDDGWFEADFVRDIWYAMLVHFTGPIAEPARLVDWVAARRGLELAEVCPPEAELLQWRYDGVRPVRDTLVRVRFAETV